MWKQLRVRSSIFLTPIVLLLAGSLAAEDNGWVWGPQATQETTASAKRLVDSQGIPPAFVLDAADAATVAPIAEWNLAGNAPLRTGVERSLPEARLIAMPLKKAGSAPEELAGGVVYASDDGTLTWAFALRVDDAWRLRLRLGSVRLPQTSRMWVYSTGDEVVGPFGLELSAPDGTLWTPSVAGPEIRFELEVPAGSWSTTEPPTLKVEGIAEIFQLDRFGVPRLGERPAVEDMSCVVDAACVSSGDFSVMDVAKRAVAHLQFQKDGSTYICTGSLVNDKDQSTTVPYMLTANHCFATQSSASSLEAFFDYIPSSCGGFPPSLGSRPRSSGSTLLKTSATNDFTFVRLNQLPSGRALLGWTTSEPGSGTTLHRLSHPDGEPMAYSAGSKVANPSFTCGLSTGNYHFSSAFVGGVFGGSSGSSLVTDSGQIVGQLQGSCGPNPDDGCDYSNYDFDGKFSVTFPQISQYINVEGGGGGGTGACTNDLTNGVVCLRSGRFEFTGTWTDFANPANTRPLIWTPVEDINATGGFQNNPSGIQVVMRVADGCTQSGTWWVWLGGFTDAGWSIRVRDTVTGKQTTFNRTRQSGAFPTTQRDMTTFNCN